MRAARSALSGAILAGLTAVGSVPLEAQRGGDAGTAAPKDLGVTLPATRAELDSIWSLHNTAVRAGRLASGATLSLWEIHAAAPGLLARMTATQVKRAPLWLCREDLIAEWRTWREPEKVKITVLFPDYNPSRLASGGSYHSWTHVAITHAPGKLQVHLQGPAGQTIPGLEQECPTKP